MSTKDHPDDDRAHQGDREYDSSTRDIEMRWQEIEKDFKSHYPELSEEDLKYREGEFNEMIERIAKRTNKSSQEVRDKIWEWDSDRFEAEDEYDNE